jgi:hypothetical protein
MDRIGQKKKAKRANRVKPRPKDGERPEIPSIATCRVLAAPSSAAITGAVMAPVAANRPRRVRVGDPCHTEKTGRVNTIQFRATMSTSK